jgi:hypothetical protein
MTYLAKKIKADKVIDNLQKAVEQLEIAQRQAVSFFGKVKDVKLKEKLNYKFNKKDKDNYYRYDSYGRGITPEDCRDQLREWAEVLAQQKVENKPEGKKLKELKLLEVAKSIQDSGMSSKRYGRLFALRDLMTEINTMKDNLDFTSYIKIKTLIEGSINKVKQDIKNNEQFADPYLDKM